MFKNWLSGRSSVSGEPPASVLAEWNRYAQSTDIESGAPNSTSETQQLLQGGAEKVQTFLKDSLARVTNNVTTGVSGLSQASQSTLQMPSTTQFLYFAGFLVSGAVFLFIAFFVCLPMLILSPGKFAFSFTLGSSCIMASLCALWGWKTSLTKMTSPERLPFTIGYIGSMVATLYAAMYMKSYLLSVIFSGVQVVALLYYVLSFFPGGTTGMRFLFSMLWQTMTSCLTRRT